MRIVSVKRKKRLSDFKKEQMLIAPNSEQNFYARIEAETERLEQAQLELRQLQSQLDSARRQLQGEDFTVSEGDVGISGFTTQYDERIKTLQTQLDAYLIRFTDSHPDVIENAQKHLKNLQKMKKAGDYVNPSCCVKICRCVFWLKSKSGLSGTAFKCVEAGK